MRRRCARPPPPPPRSPHPWLTPADVARTLVSLPAALLAALTHAPRRRALLSHLAPYLALLTIFTALVLLNGSVALGDKTHHVPRLHAAQLLYLGPCLFFFSWPILVPHLLITPRPRPGTCVAAALLAALVVHTTSTPVHPFSLADNRHYPFYVLRLLLRSHPLVRFAVIPVYLLTLWAAALATAGGTVPLLALALPTALHLASAPLVEPRYFILPWLFWRLHVASAPATASPSAPASAPASTPPPAPPPSTPPLLLLLETLWALAVHAVTGWLFLHRGFEWAQEPGVVQRFLW